MAKHIKPDPISIYDDVECNLESEGWGVLLGVLFIIFLAFLIYKTI